MDHNFDVFKIWMAGFYEGEGTVVNDISNNNKIRVFIYQNDPQPFNIAVKFWKGKIRKRERKSPASDKICTNYEFRLCHHESLKFINDIKPYMCVPYKIKQIQDAVDKSNTKLNKRFKCYYCENTYASPSGRRRHVKQSHEIDQHTHINLSNVM